MNLSLSEKNRSRPLKRNDVVFPKNGFFYGRVVRRVNIFQVEVIDCGRNIRLYEDTELNLALYKGYRERRTDLNGIEHSCWRRMPSLRKLKQMAACYQPDVWARKRTKPTHTGPTEYIWWR